MNLPAQAFALVAALTASVALIAAARSTT